MSAKMLFRAFKLPRVINRGLRAVLVAMADHASDDGVCWPGIVGLAEKTALSDRMVQLMIRKAQGIELVPGKALVTVESRIRDNGSAASNVYVLNLPDPHPEKVHPGETRFTTPPIDPVKPSSPPGETQFTTPVKPVSPLEVSVEPSVKKDPPKPPATAGGCEGAKSPKPEKADSPAEAAVAAAYREVFGTALPADWSRKIHRAEKARASGDAEQLAKATAADIREGQARAARRKGGVFGWGWFRGALRDRIGRELATEAARRKHNSEAAMRAAEGQQREQRIAEARRKAENWQGLTEDARRGYRERARARPGGTVMTEIIAVGMAWDERATN